MIYARSATTLRPLAGALLLTLAVACASNGDTSSSWPELLGDYGGGGAGGAPTTSASASGGAPAAGGGGASPSSGGGESSDGGGGEGGGGAPCGDTGPGEPNDIEATAVDLGNITDCDDTGRSVSGVLTSASDVDWYRYGATDQTGCTVDPSRAFSPAGGARLCKFAQCLAGGAADVSCELGSSPATSPSGRPGCCHTQGFSMDIDCAGIDDDASIFLRVDRPAAACASYSIIFHY